VRGVSWIKGYYLASPLFWLLGLWWGMEIRVTFLPDPGPRFLYYLGLSGLGLLAHFRPRSAPWVALGESSLNLLLIMLWILLPVYSLSENLMGPEATGVPYTPGQVLVNGLLAGSFFLLGFYRAQDAIVARIPWMAGRSTKSPGSR
jgi:hypothetical protein